MNKINLDKFLKSVKSISYAENTGAIQLPAYLQQFFEDYGGLVVNHGWYRIHTKFSAQCWMVMINEVFPEYPNSILPIGFDWMGRHFAMDTTDGNMVAFCVEFWDFQAYYCTLEQFHNELLAEDGPEIFNLEPFNAWREENGGFEYDECLACTKSLLKDGKNDWDNLGRENMWEYWLRVSDIRQELASQRDGEMAPSG